MAVLKYKDPSGEWIEVGLSQQSITPEGIGAIPIPESAQEGQILTYNGESWEAADAPPDGVTSVNGQTGDVIIEVPVKSVNGQTGDVQIELPEVDYPVTSVNGQTGDITLDIPEESPPEVFIATINTTTFAEVLEAFNTNKVIFAVYTDSTNGNFTLNLTRCTSTFAEFRGVGATYGAKAYNLNSNGWSEKADKTIVDLTDLNRTTPVHESDTNYDMAMARGIMASTTDLIAGSSSLTSGTVYLVYE